MKTKNKAFFLNMALFGILFFAYLAATLFLFHRQTVNYDGRYVSDVQEYIAEMANGSSAYSFPYPVLFWTGRIFLHVTTPVHAMAFAIALLNGLSALAIKYYMDRFLEAGGRLGRGLLSTALTFSLLFVSMLYPLTYLGRYQEFEEGFLYRYLGTFTPNPYHNATYLAARPFSIVAFFAFVEVLGIYETENKWYHPRYLSFSLALLLTTLAKPSFTLIFVAAAGIIMLWRLIRSRFLGIKAFFQMGVWFIPTFLVLLYQFLDVFEPSRPESGIGIGFLKAWSTASDNIPLSLLLGIVFPLTALLLRDTKKPVPAYLRFAWQLFFAGLFTLMFLYEKGYRLNHVNFSWGYMYGLFFTYMASLIFLAKKTLACDQPWWKLGLQWIAYGLHLLCGIDYFCVLFKGGVFL